jgi:hypothetical protein
MAAAAVWPVAHFIDHPQGVAVGAISPLMALLIILWGCAVSRGILPAVLLVRPLVVWGTLAVNVALVLVQVWDRTGSLVGGLLAVPAAGWLLPGLVLVRDAVRRREQHHHGRSAPCP